MCTVSFVKHNQNIFITSNRDEHINRAKALPISAYSATKGTLFFPKDTKAGGTWFVTTENGAVFVLLNGGFKNHMDKGNYIKSRGTVLLQLANCNHPLQFLQNQDFSGIAPFTIVYFYQNQLFQIVWNEVEINIKELDSSKPHIWSSSTLYTDAIKAKRQCWFTNFLNEADDINLIELYNFHRFTKSDDNENGLSIKRVNGICTKSITQVALSTGHVTLLHYDLIDNKKSSLAYQVKCETELHY